MEAKRIRITSQKAGKYLEAHEACVRGSGRERLNRQISDTLVVKYATDMLRDAWKLNGETVKIAKTGRILDGQHRLYAAFDRNAEFETFIIEGLPDTDDVFTTIDIGRGKRPADFLSVMGISHSAIVAPAARLVIGYRRRDLKNIHLITQPEAVTFAMSNERLQESAAKAAGRSIAPTSVLAAWHFIFAEKDAQQADKFLEDLRDGIGLEKGDPVHALREKLISNKTSRAKLAARDIFEIGVTAWIDRRKGRSRSIFKLVKRERGDNSGFPVAI